MPLNDVFSSHIDQIGHDPETGDLTVVWTAGGASIYAGVPADIAEKVMGGWSVGGSLNELVKGKFAHRYAGDGKPAPAASEDDPGQAPEEDQG